MYLISRHKYEKLKKFTQKNLLNIELDNKINFNTKESPYVRKRSAEEKYYQTLDHSKYIIIW